LIVKKVANPKKRIGADYEAQEKPAIPDWKTVPGKRI